MKRLSKKNIKIGKGMPSAVLLSIVIHVALFLLAGMLVVFTVVKKEEQKFVPPKAVERPKMKLRKPKVKVKKTAKPKPTTRIVTKVLKASVPDIRLPEMSGMSADLGGGIGGFDMMPGLDEVSMFGSGMSIGNDFEGHFYNLNYDRRGRKIPMDPDMFFLAVHKFISSGWDVSKLVRYYCSLTKLYTTHFMIPHIPSPMAPDVFGESGIEGFNFALHYKGTLVCPVAYTNGITFRFRGSGDSFMFVRVNGEIVLLAVWEIDGRSGLADLWDSSSADDRKFFMAGQLAAVGDWITLEPGNSLDMEVFFGEGRGGFSGVALAVEVRGEEYNERGWQGSNPIFPAFKTEEFSQDMIDEIYFYLPDGEVSLTNGPVFRDYAPGAVANNPVVQTEPETATPADSGGQDGIRTWTMENGRTFDAEFTIRFGTKVAFKNTKGNIFKIPFEQLVAADRNHIELETPPDLGFSFSKQSRQRDFPSAVNGRLDFTYLLPTSFYYDFSVDIKQTSPNDYNHELRAELFVIGSDIGGDAHILLDRVEGSFILTNENQRSFRLRGKTVELSKLLVGFVESGRQDRGRKYSSYLVVVTDSRGKIIALKAPKKWMFGSLEKLRELPVGSYFDKTGTRVRPSRPDPYYYHF